jgi:hypothetical protein
VKNIARAKLEKVFPSKILSISLNSRTFNFLIFLDHLLCSFQLIEEEGRGRASNYQNLLLMMMTKMSATMKKKITNMIATVAAAVATLRRVLGMKKNLRRLT